jgi:hypothetical protein
MPGIGGSNRWLYVVFIQEPGHEVSNVMLQAWYLRGPSSPEIRAALGFPICGDCGTRLPCSWHGTVDLNKWNAELLER